MSMASMEVSKTSRGGSNPSGPAEIVDPDFHRDES